MSMSVVQRRTEVLAELSGPWGKLRKAKASSKYDRRFRYFVVEWCPPRFVGTDLEEYSYRVIENWPVKEPRAADKAAMALTVCFHLFRVQYQERNADGTVL